MSRFIPFLLFWLSCWAWSCQTPIPAPRPGYALCAPCAQAGDLSCVEVKMGPDAVHLEIDGETLWFCSEMCRDQFLTKQK